MTIIYFLITCEYGKTKNQKRNTIADNVFHWFLALLILLLFISPLKEVLLKDKTTSNNKLGISRPRYPCRFSADFLI